MTDMFAALPLERAPLDVGDVPSGFIAWLQIAGGLSYVAIVIWFLMWLFALRTRAAREQLPTIIKKACLYSSMAASIAYGGYLFANLRNIGYGFSSLFGESSYVLPEQTTT